MTLRLVDPTLARPATTVALADRRTDLDGTRLGLIDNGKTHGRTLLEALAEQLSRRHRLAGTRYVRKPTVSMPLAEEEMRSVADECGAILAAVGD